MCFYILYFFVYSLLLIVYFYFTFSFLFRKMLLVPPQRLILSSQFCFILLLFDFRLILFFAKRFLFLHRDWYWHLYFTFIFFLLFSSRFCISFWFTFLIFSSFPKCCLFLHRDWYWHHKPHEMNCTAQYWRFSNFLGLTFDEFCLVYILLILSYTESSFNLTN